MSRKEHKKLCQSLDLSQDREERLWRQLDARSTGSTDVHKFLKCYYVWPKGNTKSTDEAHEADEDTKSSSPATVHHRVRAAALFLNDLARKKRWTLHEVFENVDLDQDGFVNVEDLYLFFVSQSTQRGISDPSGSANLNKMHFSGKDVCMYVCMGGVVL